MLGEGRRLAHPIRPEVEVAEAAVLGQAERDGLDWAEASDVCRVRLIRGGSKQAMLKTAHPFR